MFDFLLGVAVAALVSSPLYYFFFHDKHAYRAQRRKLAQVITWTERTR